MTTARSFRSFGKHEHNERLSGSICDALMSNAGQHYVRDQSSAHRAGLPASDEEVGRAVAFAFRELKLVVEPAGNRSRGAAVSRLDVKGKVVVGVLSGACRSGAVSQAGGLARQQPTSRA